MGLCTFINSGGRRFKSWPRHLYLLDETIAKKKNEASRGEGQKLDPFASVIVGAFLFLINSTPRYVGPRI